MNRSENEFIDALNQINESKNERSTTLNLERQTSFAESNEKQEEKTLIIQREDDELVASPISISATKPFESNYEDATSSVENKNQPFSPPEYCTPLSARQTLPSKKDDR